MVILRELNANDEAAFFSGLAEWPDSDRSWHTFAWSPGMAYSDMLEILRKEKLGIDLAPGRVPHTMLYGFVDGAIVGRVSVRHELNDHLRHRGGHIGYAVAPKFRKRGYATEMFRQGLDYCRSLGHDEIMITCGDENFASIRMIESAGGELKDRVWDSVDEETIRRYAISMVFNNS